MIEIKTIDESERNLIDGKAVLLYISTPQCHVCKALKPKVKDMLSDHFPAMTWKDVDMEASPEIAGQFHVFSVPTIICFFEGREYFRKSRYIAIDELKDAIRRPYDLVTGHLSVWGNQINDGLNAVGQ